MRRVTSYYTSIWNAFRVGYCAPFGWYGYSPTPLSNSRWMAGQCNDFGVDLSLAADVKCYEGCMTVGCEEVLCEEFNCS